MAEIKQIDKDILALEDIEQEDNDPDDELYKQKSLVNPINKSTNQ